MRSSCYVDETIINDKEVKYGAVFLNNYPPSSVIELKIFVKKNINLITDVKKRPKFLKELKGSFFKMSRTIDEAKKLINRSEIIDFQTFSSKDKSTELLNRNHALGNLISKVPCKNIYIDDYANAKHKGMMISIGKRHKKNVVFLDSTEEPGIQFADALLRLY